MRDHEGTYKQPEHVVKLFKLLNLKRMRKNEG